MKSDLTFWIDLETGLVMRSVNKSKTGLLKTTQTNEMTVYKTEGQIPPVNVNFVRQPGQSLFFNYVIKYGNGGIIVRKTYIN